VLDALLKAAVAPDAVGVVRDAAAAAAEDAGAEDCRADDGDAVVVPKREQLPPAEVPGVGARLVRDALLRVAAAASEAEGV
jgi:hypothetical protein